jgi:CRP-like cAMP-binding protein
MLLTIEIVAILKGVDMFVDTPDYALASVAQICEEVALEPGETFIREGAIEDWMYIIADGQVRVHSRGREIMTLGIGTSVGELAVLDPEPRSADVTSLGDVLLFRIDRQPFEEIMADRPELAQSVIRALCRRIRESARVISTLGLEAEGGSEQTAGGER